MTTHTKGGPRRLRAAIVGLGLEAEDGHHRIITGEQYLLMGGSAESHAEMVETVLRLESELDRLGLKLGELDPGQLAEIAWRIDSPELHQIALRLEDGLRRAGRTFEESTPEELTELSAGGD